MKKLILGTVQLGLKYGINNIIGKPSKEECFNILEYSYDNNIRCLDTAEDYGDSEELIGQYIKDTGKEFEICTKLTSKFESDSQLILKKISKKVNSAIDRLGVHQIYLFYLHSFKHVDNSDILKALEKLKESNLVKYIGVSIYEPSELKIIIEKYADIFDVVQLPFNLLDCNRWLENNILNKAKEKNINIFARSTFLQGLIFKSSEDQVVKMLNASKYIEFLNDMAKEKNIPINKLAYGFVNSIKEIDSILIGCESKEQLQQNVDILNSNIELSMSDIENVLSFCRLIDNKIIDPRKW